MRYLILLLVLAWIVMLCRFDYTAPMGQGCISEMRFFQWQRGNLP